MTSRRGLSLLILTASVLLGFAALPALAVTGVGAAPEAITFDEARRGESRLATIDVLGSADEDSLVSFTVDGAAAPWLDLLGDRGEAIDELLVPLAGRAAVDVALQVPDAAANGRYSAAITLTTRPVDTGSDLSEVEVAVVIPVVVDVAGSQQIAGRMTDVVVAPVAEVASPLRFELVVRNGGNVAAVPEVAASLLSDGTVVATTLVTGTEVPPGDAGVVSGSLVTSQLEPGAYGVRLSASLAGQLIETHEGGVELVTAGSLDRDVRLTGLEVTGASRAGEVATVEAEYRNGGPVPAEVRFVGDVRRDGLWVAEISSVTITAQPGDDGVLESFFAAPDSGIYDVEGRLIVDGVPGDIERVRLGIDVPFYATLSDWVVAAIAALLVFPAFLVAVVAWDRRRQRKAAAARERVLRKLGQRPGTARRSGNVPVPAGRGHRSTPNELQHGTPDLSGPIRPPAPPSARRPSFRPRTGSSWPDD